MRKRKNRRVESKGKKIKTKRKKEHCDKEGEQETER